MIRNPAPYIRGFAVLAIGASFVIGHGAFAAQKTEPGIRVRTALMVESDQSFHQPAEDIVLAENCYLEMQEEVGPNGKPVSQLVHDCD